MDSFTLAYNLLFVLLVYICILWNLLLISYIVELLMFWSFLVFLNQENVTAR